MKPRIFVGSSGKAKKYAEALHDSLSDVAECTVWTEGAFGLSASTVANLLKNLRDSDFGAFIFAPDDKLSMNGDLLNVPRDNVVFEAGLFSGYLCPERCFIAIPQSVKIHVLTDLLGFTVGHYEDQRTDANHIAAVGTFSRMIRKAIDLQGLFHGSSSEKLRELITQFECCNWIPENHSLPDPYEPRVKRKKQVCVEIDAFCEAHRVNKHRLLAQNSTGHYIALLSAISKHPQDCDSDLIQRMNIAYVPAGFAYYRLMDAAEALKAKKCCTTEQLVSLSSWLKQLPNADTTIANRIAKFPTPCM